MISVFTKMNIINGKAN